MDVTQPDQQVLTGRGLVRLTRPLGANRIRLGEDLLAVRSRMSRHGAAHGLIAIDLDRFKLINDRFGHPGGDDVLQKSVAAIRRNRVELADR